MSSSSYFQIFVIFQRLPLNICVQQQLLYFAMNGFSRSLELMQAIVGHYFRSMHITLFGLSCPESCLKRSSLEI